MARKSEEPLSRHNIHLYKGDYNALRDLLGKRGVPINTFIRALVRKKLREIQSVAADVAQPVELPVDDRQLLADVGFE